MSKQSIEEAVSEILAPLLEADGGTVELVEVDGDVITLRLGGAVAVCSGSRYTRLGVVQPLLEQAAGKPVHVKIERQYARPRRRSE
jgi:NifU-like protein